MNKPLFSVLTYNLDGYETFMEINHEIMNPNAEYVYLTNDRSISSNTWTVKYVDYPENVKSVFDAIYYFRYHPFDYVNSDVVLKIDGSVEMNTDMTPLIQFFIDKNYDIGVMIHQNRNTLLQEYLAWAQIRHYNIYQIEKCIKYIQEQNYDIVNYKGLYAATVQIQKNDDFNKNLNNLTYSTCKYLGEDNELGIERVDQIIHSFILNKYYSHKNVLALNSDMLLPKKEFTWHVHNNEKIINEVKRSCDAYLFNEKCMLYSIF